MKLVDEQIRQLESLKVESTARKDFDSFWKGVLKRVEAKDLKVKTEKLDFPIKPMRVEELSYAGLDGTRVAAFRIMPAGAKGKVPMMVAFHGASGSKGMPDWYAKWTLMGVGVIAIDFRLQGGCTGSASGFPSGEGFLNNWMTFGILDREACYPFHIYTDALLALKLARETEGADPSRVGVIGGSQGGAMALATAGLDEKTALCVAAVPSNCWIEKRIFGRSGVHSNYSNVIRQAPELADKVCENLSYFDNLNIAPRIKCPALIGVGLNDPVCPPDTIYAACNKMKAKLKTLIPYPFSEHSLPASFDTKALAFVGKHLLRA